MNNKIWKKLPMDIVNKIILYQETPSCKAFKAAKIRPITTSMLMENCSGTIELNEEPLDQEQYTELDIEWFQYLVTEYYDLDIIQDEI